MHINIFHHARHCLFPPGIVALSAQQSACYSQTLLLATTLPVSLCQYKLITNTSNTSGLRTTIQVHSQQVRNDLSHTVILRDLLYPLCCFPTETNGNSKRRLLKANPINKLRYTVQSKNSKQTIAASVSAGYT